MAALAATSTLRDVWIVASHRLGFEHLELGVDSLEFGLTTIEFGSLGVSGIGCQGAKRRGLGATHLDLVGIHVGQVDVAYVDGGGRDHGLMESHGIIQMMVVDLASQVASMAANIIAAQVGSLRARPEAKRMRLANRPQLIGNSDIF